MTEPQSRSREADATGERRRTPTTGAVDSHKFSEATLMIGLHLAVCCTQS